MNILKNLERHAIKFILAIVFIILILFCYHYKNYFSILKNPNDLKDFILSFGNLGIIIFIFFQIFQVVIFFIPGEVLELAGGYAYGTFGGTFLTLLGISIGSIIVFIISRKYGRSFVEKIVPIKYLNYLEEILNNKKTNLIVFILYLLPGIPKDSIIFVCGISKISLKNFIIYSSLGRIPAIIITCYFGYKIAIGNNITLFITLILLAIIFIIGALFGKKVMELLYKHFNNEI